MATRKASARESFQVHLDADELGVQAQIGTLWRHDTRTDVPAAFEYTRAWLKSPHAFMLDPCLDLYTGEQHPAAPNSAFGVFLDSAPDRWGRVLMERREMVTARREDRQPRRLQDIDFLLGVHDQTRMGALRLRVADDTPFLDNSPLGVPPVAGWRCSSHPEPHWGELAPKQTSSPWMAACGLPSSLPKKTVTTLALGNG